MVVNIPPSLEQFCEKFCQTLTKAQRMFLKLLLTGLLLVRGKRTQAALGRSVKRYTKHRSLVCRLFRRASFRTRELHRAVCRKLIALLDKTAESIKRTWVLIIDSTATKRGGFTKIANAQKYRWPKNKKSKTKSSKAHTFVMGLLITETGFRIPLARRSYYTRDYCRKNRKPYRSQQALAELMIRELILPRDVELIVIADEYFEGKRLWNVCAELGYTWIVPVDCRRSFADEEGRYLGKSLHARGKALPRSAYEEMVLIRGEEKTVSYRRYSTKRASPKSTRCYRIAREIRPVTSLGEALIVYSWKSPVYRPWRDPSKETFKVLLSNNLSMTAQEVVEWYELRWQIELYFRELKSYIGLADFRGQDFEAFERHVDLVMLAFVSQEWRRKVLIEAKPAPKLEGQLRAARTAFMQELLEQEAESADLEYIRKCLATEDGRRELLHLLPALRQAS